MKVIKNCSVCSLLPKKRKTKTQEPVAVLGAISEQQSSVKQTKTSKCEHEKNPHSCKKCWKMGRETKLLCVPHGNVKAYCKPCGGSQICEHKKNRVYCDVCKWLPKKKNNGGGQTPFEVQGSDEGSKQIENDIWQPSDDFSRSVQEARALPDHPLECESLPVLTPSGSDKEQPEPKIKKTESQQVICSHGIKLYYCRDCGGKAFCFHGKRKHFCKECNSQAFCAHGKMKARCKDCEGCRICPHGKEKYVCKKCGGSQICEHGRVRRLCKDCKGPGFCEHGRLKHYCIECGGSSICPHKRRRDFCKDLECQEEMTRRRAKRPKRD
jgi:hypothetical protein